MSTTSRSDQIELAEHNLENNICAFCSICEYGKPIKIDDEKEGLNFIVCKFTLNRDIQIAFDSRNGSPCARFKVNPFLEGFLDQANILYDINNGQIELTTEYPDTLIIYPLPQTSKERTYADYSKKLTYRVIRRDSDIKWQLNEEKLAESDDEDDDVPFFIDWKYDEKNYPLFTSILEPYYRETT